ncbi:MAG: nodulation protein NfeD [Dehalococcoidia bacterium]|nr:nodulation protein NfeD [Dehalococcoidia bacterium]
MWRLAVYTCLVLLALSLLVSNPVAAAPLVRVLEVHGDIVPVVADYLDKAITRAENDGAAVVVIKLSTPGGLLDTTQRIVQRILNARVPIVVYVSPAGGWAGSAGTFITIAAHVAAMAPGSRIGAATPVAMGTELPEEMKKKVTEDAAAFIRSIAEMRGKDPEQAENAVTEARSYSDSEALARRLIDIRAKDLDDLLNQLDGRKVKLTGDREVVINTRGYVVEAHEMNFVESLMHVISNPNIAYLLLSLASIGLIVEISNPGLIFPGVFGGICLLLAFYSLGVLNASWGGVALIMLAFGLLVADLFVASHGVLTAGGVVSMVLGSLMLFSGGASYGLEVNRGLIAGVVTFVTAFFVFVLGAIVRGQRRRPAVGREEMVGQTARALTRLAPRGTVFFQGERWDAELDGGSVEAGEEVIVTKVDGLKLLVRRK